MYRVSTALVGKKIDILIAEYGNCYKARVRSRFPCGGLGRHDGQLGYGKV